MYLDQDSNDQQMNPFASALEPVWEKVRTTAALMAVLREEKVHLEERIAGLEESLRRNTEVLLQQEEELARLKSHEDSQEPSSHGPVQCPVLMAPEERVQLQQKIKTVLSKIDSRLSTP